MIIANGDTLRLTRLEEDYVEMALADGTPIRINSKTITILTEEARESYLPTINPVRLFTLWLGKLCRRALFTFNMK
ncbi:unnamed protein product [marine sediment metagenome]|uniref:Uncharacterized protein n=1 Tax=marine sediment metagenome TaxID=412755 RepID=X1IG65_9ZZZZ